MDKGIIWRASRAVCFVSLQLVPEYDRPLGTHNAGYGSYLLDLYLVLLPLESTPPGWRMDMDHRLLLIVGVCLAF